MTCTLHNKAGFLTGFHWKEDRGYEENDFRIYQGIGTDDPIWDQTDSQIQEMFIRETFTPQNLHYAIIEGGRRDMDACERYLYYALQDFFGEEA